jgi:N-methylhydantoinase A/oxoprolinase/acetone carboxylase beta subunit
LINGYQELAHEIDVITVRVVATGRTDPPPFADVAEAGATGADADRAGAAPTRSITWAGATLTVPVHRRSALRADSIVAGPAIVTEATTTLVVPPGFELRTDRLGNGLMVRVGTDVGSLIDRLSTAGRAPAGSLEVGASARA